MNVPAQGAASFCKPSPTTWPPAVVASSESSSNESEVFQPLRDFSSTPTRKTRSVLLFLVSINAFNPAGLCLSNFSGQKLSCFGPNKSHFFGQFPGRIPFPHANPRRLGVPTEPG